VLRLFPSARGLEPTWHSIVKIGQSLYNEGPGMDPFRPDQRTPVQRMFLAGSYTKQDYIDSMCAPLPLGAKTGTCAAYVIGTAEWGGKGLTLTCVLAVCREGATLSGRMCAYKILEAAPSLAQQRSAAVEEAVAA
jgi:zeta-carotene desaturase